MRNTAYKRQSSASTHIWRLNYLSGRALDKDIAQACQTLSGDILDLGCGNSPYRKYLPTESSYIPYDIDRANKGAQIIGSAIHLPFKDHSFDSVLCTQVLEHVDEPWTMMTEISRVLKARGRLVLSAPQAWRIHEKPYDYYRYTRFGLDYLIEKAGMQISTVRSQGGAWSLAGQVINNHIWRNPPSNKLLWIVSRSACTAMTTVINIVCVTLDSISPDAEETINYVAIAEKR
jgi:SAM-dependent methyltransferase